MLQAKFGLVLNEKEKIVYFNPTYYVHRLNQFSNALWLSEKPRGARNPLVPFLSSQITNNNRLAQFFFLRLHFNFFSSFFAPLHTKYSCFFFSSFRFYKSNWFNGRERARVTEEEKKAACKQKQTKL